MGLEIFAKRLKELREEKGYGVRELASKLGMSMAKSTMKRNPKGMGHYFMTPSGKYAWRKRIDGDEKVVTADSSKELQEKVNEIIDLKLTKSKLKVDEWFTQWLRQVEGLKKPATYNQYRDIYKKHIKPEICQ